MSEEKRPLDIKQTKAQKVFMEWTIDVLLYTTILNIFVHFVSDFYVESFMYSLATAIVLKAVLVVVMRFEHNVNHWFKEKEGKAYKILHPISMWAILFGSKFLILEIIDFIFRGKVDLHNIVALIAMIIVMMFSREIFYMIYRRLG